MGSPGHEKQQETETHAILPTPDSFFSHKTVLIGNRYSSITLGVIMAEMHTEQLQLADWQCDIAPDLFLLARKKNISVASAIVQGTWMVGLRCISSALQLRQFIGLWTANLQIQR